MEEEKNSNYQEKGSLYDLLPAIYRQHEFDQLEGKRPKPLKELLGIIEEQVALMESDISQLYDNWFIESCQEWVVPYVGDLLGVKGVRPASEATFSQRAWIANTLSHRRRKGTLAMLEQLSHDVTDWNAKAVEFFQNLSSTQNMNHIRPSNATFDMRKMDTLDLAGTPFDTLAHTTDVRHIASRRGLHNIQNIGIFLWRLQSYHVHNSPAYDHGSGRFSFSQLGNDVQLFNHPVTEERRVNLTQEVNVPGPIRRRALHERPELYYGEGKSITITKDGVAVDASSVVSCDLTGWENVPKEGKVAVDPVLGRILFSAKERPAQVRVSYYYGFSADIGGGSYFQHDSRVEEIDVYEIAKEAKITSIAQAIEKWKKNPKSAIFEITDSDVYEESIGEVLLPAGVTLTMRAGEGKRPVIKLLNPLTFLSEATSPAGSGLRLEGLLVECPENESTVVIKGSGLSSVDIRHCTIVPEREASKARSIELDGVSDEMTLRLYRTICGRIATQDTRAALEAKDSIIDGKGQEPAISFHRAKIENCTIFGSTSVIMMDLASNTIFSQPAISERLQKGCARFCYVPPGSRLGMRYRCQPSGQSRTDFEVRPSFVSERYGDPHYAQLHINTDREISEGADNGNEMGAFNHLLQRHRLANLESSIEEYMRFGMEVGVFLVT